MTSRHGDVLYVIGYMRKQYYSDVGSHRSDKFEWNCYKKWAINEVYNLVANDITGAPVLDILEAFRYQMDVCSCNARTDSANMLFATAYDVVTDVIDTLITYEG